MDEELFNMEIRKFLKQVGVTGPRAIEQAVRQAMAAGRLKGGESLEAKVRLTIDKVGLAHEVSGTIKLGGPAGSNDGRARMMGGLG